jgi:hypothetical protein
VGRRNPTDKSFLLLFFKKEVLFPFLTFPSVVRNLQFRHGGTYDFAMEAGKTAPRQ